MIIEIKFGIKECKQNTQTSQTNKQTNWHAALWKWNKIKWNSLPMKQDCTVEFWACLCLFVDKNFSFMLGYIKKHLLSLSLSLCVCVTFSCIRKANDCKRVDLHCALHWQQNTSQCRFFHAPSFLLSNFKWLVNNCNRHTVSHRLNFTGSFRRL